MPDSNQKSPHILNASSNLLGLCFIVLTSIKLLDKGARSVIDEVTLAAIILFMASCILSFLSIRNDNAAGVRFEKAADIIFMMGLILLFLTTLLFSFDFIQ